MKSNPPSQPDSPTNDLTSRAEIGGAWLGIGLVLLPLAMFGWWADLRGRTILLGGLELFFLWAALVAVIELVSGAVRPASPPTGELTVEEPEPRTRWGSWVFYAVGLYVMARFAAIALASSRPLGEMPAEDLRFIAVTLLASAALLYFLTSYARRLSPDRNSGWPRALLPLASLCGLAAAVAAGCLFLEQSVQLDYAAPVGWALAALALVLSLEPLLGLGVRFYLPKAQRKMPLRIGASVLLDTLFGSTQSARRMVHEFETLIGGKVSDLWIVEFLRQSLGSVVIAGILLGWLSTGLTAVPLDSEGVCVSFGRFEPAALPPGLHISLPWPLGGIEVVETERIREISLGFDRDLDGPVLWTQRHYEGEQNLLVGDGESLLTIDVPIQYRVTDPIAFLEGARDVAAALKSLANRKLVKVAQSREGFAMMTADRDEIARELRAGLQAEADRLRLGVEISFVQLRDVHPPVDVAPAYEQVVSAEEQKEAIIDLAEAYQASVIPAANAESSRLLLEADAAKTQRTDEAAGEAERFTSLVGAEQEAPALFRARLRYQALDVALPAPAKFIIGLSGRDALSAFLDFRTGKRDTPVEIAPPPSSLDRSTPAEVPEH